MPDNSTQQPYPARPWTPGPWKANDYDSGVIAPRMPTRPKHTMNPDTKKMEPVIYTDEPRTHGYGCGNQFVCDLNDGEYHEYTNPAEQAANAALIALAPEMAEHVIEVARALGEMPFDIHEMGFGSLMELADTLRAIGAVNA